MKKKIITSILSIVASSYLYAADNIETTSLAEVTVTAEKEENTLANVPMSISVLKQEDIEEQNIIDTYDIVNSVSGLSMIKTGHHGVAGFLSLRGITPTMEGEQSIGFFVDDVYSPMFDAEVLDIKRVEVLKGPQGTLYGKNTESGVINIITNEPQSEDSALVSVDIGNYNTQKYKTIINKAINDDFFIRGAFRKYLSDGYFTNNYNSNDKLDKIDGYDGRLSFRYLPDDNWDLIFSYDKSDYDNGYTGFTTLDQARTNPGNVNTNFDGESLYDNDKVSLKAYYENDRYAFTSITAKSKTKNYDYNDLDFTSTDMMKLKIDKEIDFLSQEFRLNSSVSDNFEYLLGAYFSDEQNDQFIDFEMPSSNRTQTTNSKIDTSTYALFTQGNYKFSKFFDVTAGLRYNVEKKEIDYNQYSTPLIMNSTSMDKSKKFTQVLPKISFNFNIENHLLYASYSKGYKSGGFNPLVASTENLSYDGEESYNYEIGIKSTLLENTLFSTFSMYHIDIDNQQVELQSYPSSTTTNAGKSSVNGLELELKYQANNNLLLSIGGSYNKTKFDEYTYKEYSSGGALLGTKDYSGKMPTNTPKYTYNLSAKYNFDKETYLLGKINAYGKTYYDLNNTVQEDPYATVDLTLGTKIQGFGVKFWGKNIFDEAYTTRVFEMSGSGYYGRSGSPRTFGVALSKKF